MFDSFGNLIVADALEGLLSVDSKGNVTVLTNSVIGQPIKFADDLAIASGGMIYSKRPGKNSEICGNATSITT